MSAAIDRMESVFAAAAALESSAERAAFLEAECGGDPALKGRIEALLRANDKAEHALDRAATGAFEQPMQPGTMVAGRYKLLEEIGEGGMGVVWIAEQTEPMKRKVALKLVKAGMDSRSVVARFEAERQALALMDHPNIAKVLDGGIAGEPGASATGGGRPFFVMEYVKGVPITEYCDATRLNVTERLQLFMQVCSAVQHAHQKGIIHRDLKPSNILVAPYDDKPVPKVIDFGLAKAMHQALTERTLHTAHETVLGTPLYMSPEQAQLNNLDVDTRSDIYSLGVLLYELLTGTTPLEKKRFKEAAWDEIRRLIREEEPPRPSTRLSSTDTLPSLAASRHTEPLRLTKLIRGDLDWIVMKALEKDRTRRYDTANGFAMDVQRYLAGEPVLAAPPSASYRVRKFATKHRAALATAATLAFVLLAATAVSGWLAVRATRAEATARQSQLAEADRAEGERQANEQAQKRLRQVEKSNEILGSIFADLDPCAEVLGGRPLGAILGEHLDRAAVALDAEATGDRLSTAKLQETLGMSIFGLGNPRKAVPLLEKAVAARSAELGDKHADTLNAVCSLGSVYRAAGTLDRASGLLERALNDSQSALGEDHATTNRIRDQLALTHQARGHLDRAIPLLQRVLQSRESQLGDGHFQTALSRNNLAGAHMAAGKLDLAVPLYVRSLESLEKTKGPDHPETLWVKLDLAMAHKDAGHLEQAYLLMNATIQACEAKLGDDHPQTLSVRNALATIHIADGKPKLAIPLLERTLRLQESRLGDDHPHPLITRVNLATAYGDNGQYHLSSALLERTVKVLEAKRGEDHPETLNARASLAVDYFHARQLDLAVPLLERTLKEQESKLGDDHPRTLSTRNNLAATYLAATKVDRALSLHEKNLKLSEAKLGDDHPDTLQYRNNLAAAHQDAGHRDQALQLHARTFEGRKTKLGEDHPGTLESMHNTALAYRLTGQVDRAVALHQRLLDLARKRLGSEHPDLMYYLKGLADDYRALNRVDDAIPLFAEARRLGEAHLGKDHPRTLVSLNDLAVGYQAAGRMTDALPLFEDSYARQCVKPGREHPHTLTTMGNLAVILLMTGQTERSLKLHAEFVDAHRQQIGAEQPRFAGLLAQVGTQMNQHKCYVDAEKYLRESLAIREKKEPDAWMTFNTKSLLGEALLGQKKPADAESLLLAGYDGLKQRETQIPPPIRQVRMVEALKRLVNLCDGLDRPADAAKWRTELEARK